MINNHFLILNDDDVNRDDKNSDNDDCNDDSNNKQKICNDNQLDYNWRWFKKNWSIRWEELNLNVLFEKLLA